MTGVKIKDIMQAIEEFAPRALQEDYDNAGLQVGDPDDACSGVLLSLDVSEATVEEAAERGCNLIITHHPLLFKGVKSISPATQTGRILLAAIRKGIAIYAAHTNLDNARGGVSWRMAEKLGLTDVSVLQPQCGKLAKVVVFVPGDYVESVKAAMFAAGAGNIGDYDSCAYRMSGTGSFRPRPTAHPFVGEAGKVHFEPEERLEVIVPAWKADGVVRAMAKAHPYEEPAYDIIPLANADAYSGSGVVGNISPTPVSEFAALLKRIFGVAAVRFGGDMSREVRRVAMCGGSGAAFITDAIRSGADIYVTGDLKYHDYTTYLSQIRLADIGHYESEQCTKEIFYGLIQKKMPNFATYSAMTDKNPVNYI